MKKDEIVEIEAADDAVDETTEITTVEEAKKGLFTKTGEAIDGFFGMVKDHKKAFIFGALGGALILGAKAIHDADDDDDCDNDTEEDDDE